MLKQSPFTLKESEVPSKYMKEAEKCEVDGVVSVCCCNDISPECRHTGYGVICELLGMEKLV